MLVGVPKEIKTEEYRVGLVPATVRELVARGHRVEIRGGQARAPASPMKSMSRPARRLSVRRSGSLNVPSLS